MTRVGRGAAAAIAALALAATGLLAAPAQAADPTAPKLSSGSGPVGTTIKITGSCGTPDVGSWLTPQFRLYFPDAFVDFYGKPSAFVEVLGSISPSGKYSGSIKVPAKGTYIKKGPGAAVPGPEVTKPVSGEIRVVTICQNSESAFPWNDLEQAWTKFMVTDKALVAKSKPVISGKPKVGKTLTASTGTWKPKPSTYKYQWYKGKSKISGKKGKKSSYKVTKKDRGKKLKVKVTAKRSGYAAGSATSSKVTIKG
jgi:hypothetical protein